MGKATILPSQFLRPPGTSYLFLPSCSKPISLERPWPLEGRPQQVQKWQTNESGTSDKVLGSKFPCTSLSHAEQSKEGDKWPLAQCMGRLFITCQKHWSQVPINRWYGLLTAVHTYNRALFGHERTVSWCMSPCDWSLKTLGYVKEARHKPSHGLWFHLMEWLEWENPYRPKQIVEASKSLGTKWDAGCVCVCVHRYHWIVLSKKINSGLARWHSM